MRDLFDFKPQKQHFAVFGNPIAHSLSPQVHQAFAKQFAIELEYERCLIEQGGFAQSVMQFFANNGKGLNITVPFKLEAARVAEVLDLSVSAPKAVNTLCLNQQGKLTGYNTDGEGLCMQINHLGINLHGARLLILGAGGSAGAILPALHQRKPAQMTIAARNLDRASALCRAFNPSPSINLIPINSQDKAGFDVIINATSASLNKDALILHPSLVGKDAAVIDLMYQSQPSYFLKWALENGAKIAADGLEMLICQAALSFKIWHHLAPEVKPVVEQIRAHIQS